MDLNRDCNIFTLRMDIFSNSHCLVSVNIKNFPEL